VAKNVQLVQTMPLSLNHHTVREQLTTVAVVADASLLQLAGAMRVAAVIRASRQTAAITHPPLITQASPIHQA